MKHLLSFFVLISLISSISFSQHVYTRRVAIITSLSGDITFKTTQSIKASKAWVGLDLLPKDTLFLGSNGSVRVLFMDSNLVKLDSNTKLIVGRSTRESRIVSIDGSFHDILEKDLVTACVPCISITALSAQSRRALLSESKDWTRISTEPSILPILPSKSIHRVKPIFQWFDINARHGSGKSQEYHS